MIDVYLVEDRFDDGEIYSYFIFNLCGTELWFEKSCFVSEDYFVECRYTQKFYDMIKFGEINLTYIGEY